MAASGGGVTSPCPQTDMPGDPGASFLVQAPLASTTNGMGESVRTWLVSRGKRKEISFPRKRPSRPLSVQQGNFLEISKRVGKIDITKVL